MPSPLIQKYSEQTGKPESEVEQLWEKAKKLATTKFSPDSDQYWPYTHGILRKMLGVRACMRATRVGPSTVTLSFFLGPR